MTMLAILCALLLFGVSQTSEAATWRWNVKKGCGVSQIGGDGELFIRYSAENENLTRVDLIGRMHVHSVGYSDLRMLIPGSASPTKDFVCNVTRVVSQLLINVKVSPPAEYARSNNHDGPVFWFPAKYGGVVDIVCEWFSDEPDLLEETLDWKCVSSIPASCGNGEIDDNDDDDEECDHGFVLSASGDGCSPDCKIEPGWECNGSPSVCTDIDECELDSHECDKAATCSNLNGSYACACGKGFIGDGTVGNCKDVLEQTPVFWKWNGQCGVTQVGGGGSLVVRKEIVQQDREYFAIASVIGQLVVSSRGYGWVRKELPAGLEPITTSTCQEASKKDGTSVKILVKPLDTHETDRGYKTGIFQVPDKLKDVINLNCSWRSKNLDMIESGPPAAWKGCLSVLAPPSTTAPPTAPRNLGSVNIGLKKPATQSSAEHGTDAKLANDGNANPEFLARKGGGSCTHTKVEDGVTQWWGANLQHTYPVVRLKITGRNCCWSQSQGLVIRVGNSASILDNKIVHGPFDVGDAINVEVVLPTTVEGQYVFVSRTDTTEALILCEVMIYSDESDWTTTISTTPTTPGDGVTNIALRKSSWMSSSLFGAEANLGNDGNTNPEFLGRKGGGSCLHTDKGIKEWWAVDLGDLYAVIKVKLTLRNCCDEQSEALVVRVGTSKDSVQDNPIVAGPLDAASAKNFLLEVALLKPSPGQYVFIQRSDDTEALVLCEIEVFVNETVDASGLQPWSYTHAPTLSPSLIPSRVPTELPTVKPTSISSVSPSSTTPTVSPTSSQPTQSPTTPTPTLTHTPSTSTPTKTPFVSVTPSHSTPLHVTSVSTSSSSATTARSTLNLQTPWTKPTQPPIMATTPLSIETSSSSNTPTNVITSSSSSSSSFTSSAASSSSLSSVNFERHTTTPSPATTNDGVGGVVNAHEGGANAINTTVTAAIIVVVIVVLLGVVVVGVMFYRRNQTNATSMRVESHSNPLYDMEPTNGTNTHVPTGYVDIPVNSETAYFEVPDGVADGVNGVGGVDGVNGVDGASSGGGGVGVVGGVGDAGYLDVSAHQQSMTSSGYMDVSSPHNSDVFTAFDDHDEEDV